MTISGQKAKQSFAGSGVTAYALDADFIFWNTVDLIVTRRAADYPVTADVVLVETTDYSVVGGGGANGTVNTVATYSDGWLIVRRSVNQVQPYDLVQGDGFQTGSLEEQLDKLTAMIQEHEVTLGQCLRLVAADFSDADMEIPSPLANRGFKFNTAADAIQLTTDDPDGAAASAAAAAISETNAAASEAAAGVAQTDAETAQSGAETAETNAETSATEAAASADSILIGNFYTETEVDALLAAQLREKASQTEIDAGTDDAKYATAASLGGFSESAELALPAIGVELQHAHGFGIVPRRFEAVFVCKVAEFGWAVGDEVNVLAAGGDTYSQCCFVGSINASYFWPYASQRIPRRDTNAQSAALTPASWRVKIRAWKY